MIKEEKVFVNINIRNAKIYQEMGYSIDSISIDSKLSIEVKVSDVSRNSRIRVTAICDLCGKETGISINKYWKNFERGGYNFYSCFGCKNRKKEMTIENLYGVKSFSQTDDFKNKFRKTSIERYGVDNPNKSKIVRDKIKSTNIERYGVDSYFRTDESKLYNSKWMASDDFKEKSKSKLLEKYGVDSYSKTNEFKEKISLNKDTIVSKIRETFMSRYGVDWYFKLDAFRKYMSDNSFEIDEKRKQTCLSRYGVDNVSKDKEIYKKIYQTKIDNNLIIPESELNEWSKYKRTVGRITNKHKKILYEEWDGYDYYDNEFIKGYYSYNHLHRFYPTIDHKISVYFGFINNIPVEEIGDISNLCITKRYINCSKNSLIEEAFKEKLITNEKSSSMVQDII